MKCPCHSGLSYAECCEKYHTHAQLPENALLLMRSRYSAYALKLPDYIMETTHPDHTEKKNDRCLWKIGILDFANHTLFQGLEILSFTDGKTKATVTFKALLFQNGKDVSFTEKSLFFKEDGKWLYHSGKHLD